MPRSPLTEPLLRVQEMIAHVRENLSTDEYMLFLDLLAPEPEPAKKPQKKSSKKAAGGGGRSKRASSLRQVIGSRPVMSNTCAAELPDGAGICHAREDDSLHNDSSYGNYHKFQPPATSAAGSGG